ncbi:effector-associated constant component EACC1 [Actinoplanes sp. CA-015351]|uniref:effector-associated constant component EACC1 n=1 Tax=Actinoplanes sp. CA-015351 TaxID=3239897 RepID=UPI003D98146B
MKISVVAVEDEQATLGLYRWFRDDETLTGQAVEIREDEEPTGTMGAAEVIEVVLTHGVALANLAIAYATWRDSRDDDTTEVTFTGDGGSITVKDASPETIERIVAALSEPARPEPEAEED